MLVNAILTRVQLNILKELTKCFNQLTEVMNDTPTHVLRVCMYRSRTRSVMETSGKTRGAREYVRPP